MSLERLCVLHSVDDAEDFLSGLWLAEGWEPISTHCAASDYLRHRGVACPDASEWVTLDDQRRAKQSQLPGGRLEAEAWRLCDALEAGIPCDWWEELGLLHSLPLFRTMFDYLLEHSLYGREVFRLAWERILSERKPVEVAVYHQEVPAPAFSSLDVLEEMHSAHPFQLRELHAVAQRALAPLRVRPIRPRIATYARAARKRLRRLVSCLGPVCARPAHQHLGTLLLFPEYDLRGLIDSFPPYKLLLWPPEGLPSVPGIDMESITSRSAVICARILSGLEELSPVPGVAAGFMLRMVQDFARHGAERLAALALLDNLLRVGRVNAAAWSFSPGSDQKKSIMMRYCMLSGVPVSGLQHGGNYGVQDCGASHMRADYSFCTHFFTYGCTASDMDMAAGQRVPCEVIPLRPSRKPLLDIGVSRQGGPVIFPITNCYGLTILERVSPAFLLAAQEALLAALESRTDLDVWIKPFPGATPATLSCPERIKSLRHAKVGGGSFQWFLSQRRPQLVVTEFPSEPLFQSLPHDLDIFLLLDPLFPFYPEPERLLRKRVHVFETAGEMAQAIRDYGKVPLSRLRSMEFVNTFYDRSGVQPRLVETFTEWSKTWPSAN